MNIEGNKEADKGAKAAAAQNTALIITRMRSSQYTSIQSMTNAEWTTGREIARRLRTISQYPDITTGFKLHRTLHNENT
jgi:hypothetical protein